MSWVNHSKQALAAHAMVNAIFAGTVERIHIANDSEAGAAAMMAAFYGAWNAEMWDRR